MPIQPRLAARFPLALTAPALLLAPVGCSPGGPGHDNSRHLPAVGALGPYSGSVAVDDLVYVSGKIGERGGAFEREAATAIDAVEAELARHGLTLADAVSVTVYLTDMARYAEFNGVYAARFPEPYPARAVVGVAALPGEARVEISVTASGDD
ncbi:MAG: RidA family protein [Phycisphaerales bacterium JB040]